jgi:hypothetical protein
MLEIPVSWIEQYVSALVLLNLMLGQPKATVPLQPAAPESIVRTLNEIARGLYRPSRHFGEGTAAPPLRVERKELVATGSYTVIVLNATTPQSDFVSVENGGILFEDPAWAVFAAEGLAQGRMLAVPIAASEAELGARLPRLETLVRASKYAPEEFFAPVTGFANPPVPSFSLMQVTGAQLTALRGRGIQSFGKPGPKFYMLFTPAAKRP